MELSNADYYAYAQSQGLPAPTNAQMKAALDPYVRQWKQQQEQQQREDRGPSALGLGLGALGIGGITAAMLAAADRNRKQGMASEEASQAAAQAVARATGIQPMPPFVRPPTLEPVPRTKPLLRPRMRGTGNTLRGVGEGAYRIEGLLGDPELGPMIQDAITPEERRAVIDYAKENRPDKLVEVIDVLNVRKGGAEAIELPVGYPVPDGVAPGTAVQRTKEIEIELEDGFKTVNVPVGDLEVVVPAGRSLTTVPAGPQALINRLGPLEETVTPADVPDEEGSNRSSGLIPVGKKAGASSQIGYDPELKSYLTTSVPELVVVKDQAGRPVIVTESSLNDPFIKQQVLSIYPTSGDPREAEQRLPASSFIEVGSAADWNRLDPTLAVAKERGFGVSDVAKALLPAEFAGDDNALQAFEAAYSKNSPDRYLTRRNPRLAIVPNPTRGFTTYVSKADLDALRPEIQRLYGNPAESDFWYPAYDMGGGEVGDVADRFTLAEQMLSPHVRANDFLRSQFTGEGKHPGIYDFALEDIEKRKIEGAEERTDDGGGLVNGGAAVGGAKPYEQSWLMHEGGVNPSSRGLQLGVSPLGDPTPIDSDWDGVNPAAQRAASSSTAGAITALAYAPDANLSLTHHLLMAPVDPRSELKAKMAVLADPLWSRQFQQERQKLIDLGVKGPDGSYVTVEPQQADGLALRAMAPVLAVEELKAEIPPLMEYVKSKTGFSGSAANLLGLTTDALAAAARDYPRAVEWARQNDPELFQRTQAGTKGAFSFEQFVKPYVRSYALGRQIEETSGTGGSAAMYKVPEAAGERLVYQMFQQKRPLEQVIADAIQPRQPDGRQPFAPADLDRLRVERPTAFAASPFEAALLLDQATAGAVRGISSEPWNNATRLVDRFTVEVPADGSTEFGALKQRLAQTQLGEEGLRPGLSSYPIALRFSGPETGMKDLDSALGALAQQREGGLRLFQDPEIEPTSSGGRTRMSPKKEAFVNAVKARAPLTKETKLNANIEAEYSALYGIQQDLRAKLKSGATAGVDPAAIEEEINRVGKAMEGLADEQKWLIQNRNEAEDWLVSSNMVAFDERSQPRPGSSGFSINTVDGKVVVAPDAFRHRGSPEATVAKGAPDGDWDSGGQVNWAGPESGEPDGLSLLADDRETGPAVTLDGGTRGITTWDQWTSDKPSMQIQRVAPLRGPAPTEFMELPGQGQPSVDPARANRAAQAAMAGAGLADVPWQFALVPRAEERAVEARPATRFVQKSRGLQGPVLRDSVDLDASSRSVVPAPTEIGNPALISTRGGRPTDTSRVLYPVQRELLADMRQPNLSAEGPPVRPRSGVTVATGRFSPGAIEWAQAQRDRQQAYALREQQRRDGEQLSPLPEMPDREKLMETPDREFVRFFAPQEVPIGGFGGAPRASSQGVINLDRGQFGDPSEIRGQDSVSVEVLGPDRRNSADESLIQRAMDPSSGSQAVLDELQRRGFTTVVQLNSPYPGSRRLPVRFPG